MINRYLSLVFLFFLVTACHQKQALLQRGFVQEFQQTSAPQKQIEFLHNNFSNVKNNTSILNHKIKTDTLDIKPDTLPPVKDKLIISSDTLIPKPSNIDSILVQSPEPINQAKANKLAKQAYNLGFGAIVGIAIFWPISLILAGISISMGRKALKLGTQTPQKAKDGIKMGKIALLILLVTSILAILFVLLLIGALSNWSYR